MLGFWAVAVVFVLIAFAFLLPPLLNKRNSSDVVARKDLTVTVYQDQFQELDNDLKNEVISQEQYDQAKVDLEKNLLEDIGKANKLDELENKESSPLGNKIAMVIVVLFVPIMSFKMYDKWGGGEAAIDPDSAPAKAQIAQHDKQNIEGMVGQLQARLAQDPSDGEGWFMLARTYQALNKYPEAVQAFKKALPLGGSNSADVLASYADAIAMASNRTLTDEAVRVLKQAIVIDPKHVKSLWLVGTAEYQKKNYKDALSYWETLLGVLPPGSDEANQIQANVGEVRSLLGLSPLPNAPMQSSGNSTGAASGTVSNSNPGTVPQSNIEDMVRQLNDRLAKNPEDGEGWMMLARTYQTQKKYSEAVDAFKKSMPLGGENSADVLASYADAIAMASNRTLTEEAIDVLKQAIVIDPNHVKSLWLIGTAEYQNKNYKDALAHWSQLLKVLPAGSDESKQIFENVSEVRGLLGLSPIQAPTVSSAMVSAPQSNLSDSPARIQGTVSLSGAVASKAAPEDTVFVFARAATGPRMPLAIIRKQVKDIPFDFTLDDSLAMNPSFKLSSVPQVVVGARVSKSGNAIPQPGDLEVFSNTMETAANNKPIKLVINQVVK